jgi:predicted transcriptional regulator
MDEVNTGNGTKSRADVLEMVVNIVSSYVSKNSVPADQIGSLIRSVHQSLNDVGTGTTAAPAAPVEAQRPAVPVKKSIFPDYIVCLEDGKKLKMLKRHLRTTYGLTPDEYRAKWGLAADYPMVAPNYAEQRSQFAKKIGLGRGARKRPAAAPVRRRAV